MITSFLNNYENTLRKRYATFSGRANRKEYSSLLLGYLIVQLTGFLLLGIAVNRLPVALKEALKTPSSDVIVQIPMHIVLIGLCNVLVLLVHIVPLLALVVRRGHDVGISGWWAVPLALLAGGLIMLAILPGQPYRNQYGRPPARKDELTLINYLVIALILMHIFKEGN